MPLCVHFLILFSSLFVIDLNHWLLHVFKLQSGFLYFFSATVRKKPNQDKLVLIFSLFNVRFREKSTKNNFSDRDTEGQTVVELGVGPTNLLRGLVVKWKWSAAKSCHSLLQYRNCRHKDKEMYTIKSDAMVTLYNKVALINIT